MHAIVCMKYYQSEISDKMLQFSMNDISALAYAVQLKKALLDKISVLCMGPVHVVDSLKDCISFGADNIYLVSDSLYAGSDTLITSYILSEALKYIQKEDPYHLIFCGDNTDDSGTGQVGPGLACRMGYAFISDVKKIEHASENLVITNQDYQVLSSEPVVVSIRDDIRLSFPTLPNIMKAKKAKAEIITNQELGLKKDQVGYMASPTKVVKIIDTQDKETEKLNILNGSFEETAAELIKMIKALKEVKNG